MASFPEVLGGYVTLRKRLAVYVGRDVLPDITLDPPAGTGDELSFLRLVAWSYSFLHEAGRVPLAVLKQLPPWKQNGPLLPHVRALRTWTSHNLALDEAVDRATLRKAFEWISGTCGTASPKTPVHWQSCFTALCNEAYDVLVKAVSACDAFELQEDREQLLEELQKRLDRDWAAYRFDTYVTDAANVLGYSGLDPVAFRGLHLDAWRRVLSTSNEMDVERNLRLRIQADLLALMGDALPVTAEELAMLLASPSKPHLVNAMITLRAVLPAERTEVLGKLSGLQ